MIDWLIDWLIDYLSFRPIYFKFLYFIIYLFIYFIFIYLLVFYLYRPIFILIFYLYIFFIFHYLFICPFIYLSIHDIQFELIPLHFFIFIFFFFFFWFLDIDGKQFRNQTSSNSATVTFKLITAFATKLFSRPGLKSIIIFIIITVN